MKNSNLEIQASTKIINMLAEGKDQLEANLFNMDGIFAIFNQNNQIIDANKELEDIYPNGVTFRKDIIDAILPEYKEEAKKQIELCMSESETKSFEAKLQNGRLYIISVRPMHTKRNEEGVLLKLNGTDISELRDLESQIVDVLKTINLGVIFVDHNNCIMPGYSDYTHTIFEDHDLVGKNIHELVFARALNNFSKDSSEVIESLKDFANQDEFFFKVISLTMPPKIEIPSSLNDHGSKIIKFTFEPIIEDEKVVKYMIIAQDVTELERSKPVKFSEDMKAIIDSFEKDSQATLDTIRDLTSLIERLPETIDSNATDEVKGVLHSLKGMLGMNEMKYMARLIHDIETYIKPNEYEEKKDLIQYNIIDFSHCYQKIGLLIDTIDDKDTQHNQTLSNSDINDFLAELPAEVRQHPFLAPENFTKDESEINVSTLTDTAQGHIDKNSMTFETLAELDCNIEDVMIMSDSFQAVKTSLIHMINNSFAHGFEYGSDENTIKIESKVFENKLQITYTDNGRGVNIIKMREKLIESGEDEVLISKLSDQEIANGVFKAGISTKDEVTEIAGRGIGLAGVHFDISRLGGSLTLDEFNSGCQFTLCVPISDRKPEPSIVAKDVLESAFNLFLGHNNNLKVSPGLYLIQDTYNFYKGLRAIQEKCIKNISISPTKLKNSNTDALASLFSKNSIAISIDEDTATLCLSECLLEFDNHCYPKEIFGDDAALKYAQKQFQEVLGVKLEIVNSSSQQIAAIFNYDGIKKELTPSLLRLVEQNYCFKKFSNAA